ncbi:MAG: hypothetical protein ACKPBT_20285, partial [Microcystis aeruginosa]
GCGVWGKSPRCQPSNSLTYLSLNLILSSSFRGKSQGFSLHLTPTPCFTFNLLVTPSGFWQFFSQKIRKTLL